MSAYHLKIYGSPTSFEYYSLSKSIRNDSARLAKQLQAELSSEFPGSNVRVNQLPDGLFYVSGVSADRVELARFSPSILGYYNIEQGILASLKDLPKAVQPDEIEGLLLHKNPELQIGLISAQGSTVIPNSSPVSLSHSVLSATSIILCLTILCQHFYYRKTKK